MIINDRPLYSIHKDLTIETAKLVIDVSQKGVTPEDKEILEQLRRFDKSSSPNSLRFSIPSSSIFTSLKLLATTGRLQFNGTYLIPHIFTKVKGFYEINENGLTFFLELKGKKIPLSSVSCLINSNPLGVIHESNLYFLKENLHWSDFKTAFTTPNRPISEEEVKELIDEFKEDSEKPEVKGTYVGKKEVTQKIECFPELRLKDKMGSFADLWMQYGEEHLPFHDTRFPLKSGKRDNEIESAWEKDLLETGYKKKVVGSSNYFCPLDQVPKTLSFLLELGWRVIDTQQKQVVNFTKRTLQAKLKGDKIELKGSLDFEGHQKDLIDVKGVFNRNERFLELGSGKVGLMPTGSDLEEITFLLDETEIVGNSATLKKSSLGLLRESDFSEEKELETLQKALRNPKNIPLLDPASSFNGALRPYQQVGVSWLKFLYDQELAALLADDMGLGKTVQTLAFISLLNQNKPILIVAPTSLLFNWRLEIERFLPYKKVILFNEKRQTEEANLNAENSLILVSYTILRNEISLFQNLQFEVVILDEAQTIKNPDTQVAKAVFSLKSRFRLSITGTPIENHLGELWSQFRFLIPSLLGGREEWNRSLNSAESDHRYLEKVRKKITPFYLRRKKEHVVLDLPPRIDQIVYIEMADSQRALYNQYLTQFRGGLLKKVQADGLSKHRIEVFEALLRLRQIACHPLLVSSHWDQEALMESGKLNALLKDLENCLLEGRKALIYSQFTSFLNLIGKELILRGWIFTRLDGSTKDREGEVKKFQEDPSIPFFLVSLKAGGVGLNLTAADTVFLLDPWWNEAVENQAIHRAHRIGQTKKVITKRYVASESVEQKMLKLKESKSQLIDSLFDEEPSHWSFSVQDLEELLTS